MEIGREGLQKTAQPRLIGRLQGIGEGQQSAGLQHPADLGGDTNAHRRRQFVKKIDAGQCIQAGLGERQVLAIGLYQGRHAQPPACFGQIGWRQIGAHQASAGKGLGQIFQKGARATGQIDQGQSPVVASAPSGGEERQGPPAHGSARSGEQKLDLALVAPRALEGEPAAALEVEILAVIGGKAAPGRDLSACLDSPMPPTPGLHASRVTHQVRGLPQSRERIDVARGHRRIQSGGDIGGVLFERLKPGPAHETRRRRSRGGREPRRFGRGRPGDPAHGDGRGAPPGRFQRRAGDLPGAIGGEGPRSVVWGLLVRLAHRPAREKIPISSIWGDHRNWSTDRTRSRLNPPSIKILASRAKVVGLHDTAMTRATDEPASCAACAAAPARGGSNTATSILLSSDASMGRRSRSRV